jgi:hypothetical protein
MPPSSGKNPGGGGKGVRTGPARYCQDLVTLCSKVLGDPAANSGGGSGNDVGIHSRPPLVLDSPGPTAGLQRL